MAYVRNTPPNDGDYPPNYYCAQHDMYRPCAWCDSEAFNAKRAAAIKEREDTDTDRWWREYRPETVV